jgi:hypothetical protein
MTVKLEWVHAPHAIPVALIAGETAADGNTVDTRLAVEVTGDDGVVFTADSSEDLIELGHRIIDAALNAQQRHSITPRRA